MRQWEGQTAHRQDLERKVVDNNITLAARGQWMGLLLALAVLALAGALIYNGMSLVGLGVVVAEIAALAFVFRTGRGQQRSELQQKADHLASAGARR
jgi:hypothetical protein